MTDDFIKWQDENRGPRAMTHGEMRDKLGLGKLECEMCNHFDLDYGQCDKGKRPTKIMMLDGPNEHCHMHLSCGLFDRFTDTITNTEAIDRYFAV